MPSNDNTAVDECITLLKELPPQDDGTYGIKVRDILGQLDDDSLKKILEQNEDAQEQLSLRFNAFYALQVRLRRNKNYAQHRANIDLYRHEFQEQPMFEFMDAEYYGDLTADPAHHERAIASARKAVKKLPNTGGVHHVLAEYLLESVEFGALHGMSDTERDKRLSEAELHVGRAIVLTDQEYPKFFATRGRILAERRMFSRALEDINRAIRDEPTDRDGGLERIAQYRAQRQEILNSHKMSLFRAEQEKSIKEFRSLRADLLSLLGLLAAVVAFISTSTNAALAFDDLWDGLAFLSGSGAVIVAVFGAFWIFFGVIGSKWFRLWGLLLFVVLAALATVVGFR